MSKRHIVTIAAPLAAAGIVLLSVHPWLFAVGLVLGVTAYAAHSWNATRPRRELDRLFWVLTLRPLAALPELERARRIEQLAASRLHHPLIGPTRFPARTLERRLKQVASAPLDRLLAGDLLTHRQHLEIHGRS